MVLLLTILIFVKRMSNIPVATKSFAQLAGTAAGGVTVSRA